LSIFFAGTIIAKLLSGSMSAATLFSSSRRATRLTGTIRKSGKIDPQISQIRADKSQVP
jgi:hypothetical protein